MAFEEYSKYSSGKFNHLNSRVPDKKLQERYIASWRQRYANLFKEGGEEQAFLWNIRVHKALKEVFTSSAFYLEAAVAKESRSWAAFYFLSYYSIFHAVLSCNFLIPEESLEKLSEITHSKTINVFKSHFCDKKPNIVNEKIVELYVLLKFLREYYSYNMPPNDFLYGYNGDAKADVVLPYYLRSCFQLASLLSELVEDAFFKYGKNPRNNYEFCDLVTKYFCMVNGSVHPKSGEALLHYMDKVRMRETIEYPAPVAFVIELEHFTDEFRNYESAEFSKKADGTKLDVASFVYKAIGAENEGHPPYSRLSNLRKNR